jgi:ferredoxin
MVACMKVVIDSSVCTGHGRCYSLAPEVFDCDDEGRGTVVVDTVDSDLLRIAQVGASNCPERAISIIED